MTHLISILVLLLKIYATKSCSGISLKTQELFALVFLTRYLDLFTGFVSVYNTVMKLVFIGSSLAIVWCMRMHSVVKRLYDKELDTFPRHFLVAAGFALALLVNEKFTFQEVICGQLCNLDKVCVSELEYLVMAIGAFMGTLTNDVASTLPAAPPQAGLNPQAMASLKQAQALSGGPLVQARNFAVMTGVNAGISCVMKRLRGKEDVESSMVAAFGSGAMFSLVSGMGGPNQAANAVTSGLFFALVQGGIFKIGQKFSQPPAEDVYYVRTRGMLNNLGLLNYEKNFKKGLLTDSTLPLLTDSALRDVRIPPGPRLLILDHIQRDPELREKRGSCS